MEQTPQNTFDYDSCRRVWQRVSPELDPYPAGGGERRLSGGPGPGSEAPSGAHRGGVGGPAGLSVHRPVRAPSRRPAGRSSGWLPTRGPTPVGCWRCTICLRPVLPSGPPSGPAESLPWRALLQAAVSRGGLRRPGSMTGRHKAPGMPACLRCSGTCPGTRPATPGN